MTVAEWETLARDYCSACRYRYLSHEVYGDMLHVAVEEGDERWEEKVPRLTASAVVGLWKTKAKTVGGASAGLHAGVLAWRRSVSS